MHGTIAAAEDAELRIDLRLAFLIRSLADKQRDHPRPQSCGKSVQLHFDFHIESRRVLIETDDQRVNVIDACSEHVGEERPAFFNYARATVAAPHAALVD